MSFIDRWIYKNYGQRHYGSNQANTGNYYSTPTYGGKPVNPNYEGKVYNSQPNNTNTPYSYFRDAEAANMDQSGATDNMMTSGGANNKKNMNMKKNKKNGKTEPVKLDNNDLHLGNDEFVSLFNSRKSSVSSVGSAGSTES
ncbi:hypothetical protein B5S31_g5059 [[Candida] boidinii]|nr:hypothetical protein B5S29_g5765 [[Candida] boidinii]OWB75194.1 hypothetical protein B5S31_g5059 [[Candida] boidinii]OWB80615.1 hypothetical protein B5S32_g4903 [[Candida] boidinii]GME73031.1 unnamed protein product [[Candida] boidinii]GMF06438.1 unnamed protein product [[Candida] boidinii]